MGHIMNTETAVVSSFTWDNEENAKQEFFALIAEEHRKLAQSLRMEGIEEMEMLDSGIDDIDFAPVSSTVQDEEEQEEQESLDEGFTSEDEHKEDESEEHKEEDSGFNVDTDPNDPLAPYWDEELNIAFKAFGGGQIDFAQRLGKEVRSACKVLFAGQKGTKFPYTIQRMVETENGTEYVDIMTIHYPSGAKSAFKGASAGTSKRSTGKTPEQIAEEERKRKLAEEERKRREQAKLEKAEQKRKNEEAARLQAALEAARNAPKEFHPDGSPNLAYIYFEMLHRPQGATYAELGAVNNTVNGGWKTTIRQFASKQRYDKVILSLWRLCDVKSHGVKRNQPYQAYKLIDRNRDALSNIPAGWVLDPDTYPNGLAHFDLD